MKIYQVGGAVRDKLMGQSCRDKDYVITGATEQELLSAGYKKVGKSFPVFLHPETGEEYALARKEINTGKKHGDFKFIFTPDITLKEDSLRRDFTCNALYFDENTGEIIDYHNGREDIKNRILRHISEHFAEDPLRVMRLCRFAAQLDFTVAPETMALCRRMVKEGALQNLSKPRIWQEFAKALCSPFFYRFIITARECGLLPELLPEVEFLFQVPERPDYHPEKNSGAHTLLALKAAQSCDPYVNFAVLFHDIGKTKTDPKHWPSHRGHDKLGSELIKEIAPRFGAPEAYKTFASFTAAHHMMYHCRIPEVAREMAETAVILAHNKNKDYFRRFTDVLRADLKGRAINDFTKELETFAIFTDYLRRLTDTAEQKSAASLPDFEEMLQKVKKGELPPSAINDAYQDMLIKENPYPVS